MSHPSHWVCVFCSSFQKVGMHKYQHQCWAWYIIQILMPIHLCRSTMSAGWGYFNRQQCDNSYTYCNICFVMMRATWRCMDKWGSFTSANHLLLFWLIHKVFFFHFGLEMLSVYEKSFVSIFLPGVLTVVDSHTVFHCLPQSSQMKMLARLLVCKKNCILTIPA